jgi:hypothetical protein
MRPLARKIAFCLLPLGFAFARNALGQAITEFPVSFAPINIVSGPDGNLCFTEYGGVLIRTERPV